MPESTSEVTPCLSAAELERRQIMRDDSELLPPDTSGLQSSLPLQNQDDQPFQGSVPHRTSLDTVTGSNRSKLEHPIDGLKGVPRSLSFSWASFAADTISILVTIPLIVLGLLLAQAKGEIVERNTLHNLENGVRVAATALPFAFAAIFGRLSAQVARWKLERGGSLPSIEQWLGSRTLFSAFLTQVKLGGLNVIGVSMTIAWALSPLGAQSILRVLGTGTRDVRTDGSATHFDTDTPSAFSALTSHTIQDYYPDVPAVTKSMYSASLMSADSIKASGQDLWGNTKVPFFSPHADILSEDAWVSVPDDGSVEFSSLVGIPFAVNIEPGPGLKSNFTIESSYIQLQCSPFVTTGADSRGYLDNDIFSSYENASLGQTSYPCTYPLPKAPKNGTFQAFTTRYEDGIQKFYPWVLALDTFLDNLWLERICDSYNFQYGTQLYSHFSPRAFANEKGIAAAQAKLQLLTYRGMYFNKEPNASDPLSTTCGVSQSWVESWVDCNWSTSPACVVTAQRASQRQHSSSNITHLSFPSVFTQFSSDLPSASGYKGSPIERGDASLIYLANTSLYNIFSYDANSVTIDNLTDTDISRRLGQLINTYLMISQAYNSISAGRLGEYQTMYRWSPTDNITTTMWIVKTEEIYTINAAWLTAFFITAVAMLVASIVGAVFSHSSITPEILGFASTAIRDSKYVDLAPGFGTLGGLEMTKALEKIEFRYGVVNKSDSGQEVLGVSWKVSTQRVKKRVPYV